MGLRRRDKRGVRRVLHDALRRVPGLHGFRDGGRRHLALRERPELLRGKEGGVSDASKAGGEVVSGNGLRGREHVFRGEDPTYDCYSNVCRQNAAFANAYQLDAKIGDIVFASELEGTQYQAGSLTARRMGGSSASSRAEFRRMMEKSGDHEGLQELSAREKYIAAMRSDESFSMAAYAASI